MRIEDIKPIKIPPIPDEEKTPVVVCLLEIIYRQNEIIQILKNEIAILKKQKPRPSIKPSSLEKESFSGDESHKESSGKRPGSNKKSKTAEIPIHETIKVPARRVPKGSRFKGYQDFTVQDLSIRLHNTQYRMECWQKPDGSYLTANLPNDVQGIHFGPTVISLILYQHYQQHVTQPLILEQLQEWGISISKGQISRILTEGKERFHREKDQILRTGLAVSHYLNVDDTGARHAGKNGVTTHIGNDFFAWFQSTESKSRINFLELLRAGHHDYHLNQDALDYMKQQRLPPFLLSRLGDSQSTTFDSQEKWDDFLNQSDITRPRHIRITSEGALLGAILSHGLSRDMVIVSDDAGQFNILNHALCWIHAERTINKITPFNEDQRKALDWVRSEIWDLYQYLKDYKTKPLKRKKRKLEKRFDDIFTQKTCFMTLNLALKRLYQNKEELLKILEKPKIPLHNNASENDIREYVKKRKISGGTRSSLGRQCRDTFMSLKKTCRKLGVSFWCYLNDRVSKTNAIPQLPDLILLKAPVP